MSLSDSEPSVSYSVIGIWSVSIFLTSESVDPGLSDSINWFISKNGLFCGKQRENTNVIRTSVLTYRLRGGRIPQTRSALSAYFCVLGFFVLIFVSFIIAKVWFIRDIDFVGADYCLRGERVGFDFKRFRFFQDVEGENRFWPGWYYFVVLVVEDRENHMVFDLLQHTEVHWIVCLLKRKEERKRKRGLLVVYSKRLISFD